MKHEDSKKVISFYQRKARTFDEARGKSLVEKEWLDKFLSSIPKGGRVLDIGCGSGEPIAAYMISLGYEVTGIDSSAEMLAMCEERFSDHTWILSDMRTLNLERKFDGIIAWDSFFHLNHEDQKDMFAVFEQHSKSKASLLFTAGHGHGVAINPLWGEPLYHASHSVEEYRALLSARGFNDLVYKIEDEDCGLRSVFLTKKA